ncbi:MAG: hypothetical protein ACRER2_01070 [Methylococcales bacterium]
MALEEVRFAEKAYPVELNLDSLELRQVAIVRTANIASKDSLVRHDPLNTARALMTLIDDLYSRFPAWTIR